MPDMPMGGAGAEGMPPAGGMPPMPPSGGAAGPTPTPMSTPNQNEGLQKAARVQVQMAIKLLQQQLPHFEFDSDEGKAMLSALKSLSGGFGKTEESDRQLFPAEIMQMLSGVNKGPTPGQQQIAQAPTPGIPGQPQ